jgi:hypothetical protein
MQAHDLSWADRIKKGLKLDSLGSRIDLSRARIVEVAVFLAIGFLAGVLWKKYSQYVVVGLIFIGMLIILQHLEIINVFINWRTIEETVGLDSSLGDFSTAFWAWARIHFLALLAFVIGVSIGVKVG